MQKMIIATVCASLTSTAALAHAFLDRAIPAVGSQVAASPSAVTLTYTEPVEPLFSTVHVTDATGTRMEDGKPAVHGDKQTLIVNVKKLPPGVYTVEWHVTSVDTHKTEGHFTFTVKP